MKAALITVAVIATLAILALGLAIVLSGDASFLTNAPGRPS